jgi:hypothetical protein
MYLFCSHGKSSFKFLFFIVYIKGRENFRRTEAESGHDRPRLAERDNNKKQTLIRHGPAWTRSHSKGFQVPCPDGLASKNISRTAQVASLRQKKHNENALGKMPGTSFRLQAPLCEYLLSQKPISPCPHPALEKRPCHWSL